jgi:hypothetical protein
MYLCHCYYLLLGKSVHVKQQLLLYCYTYRRYVLDMKWVIGLNVYLVNN